MKKLLELLGTITIAGSGMVGLVGNAPAPAKNEINYSQTNNLETLNRNKRSWDSQSHDENKINAQRFANGDHNFWLWISRNNWRETQKIYKESNNNYDQFKNKFFNIIKNFWRECAEYKLWHIVSSVWNDFNRINNIYISSRINYGLFIKIEWTWNHTKVTEAKLYCWGSCSHDWYKEKIKFFGLSDEYKGEIGLDIDSKKILFFGNDEQFHSGFNGTGADKAKIYDKITIKNQNKQIIKEIIINGTDSMQNIINKYNLQNGINYQNDYSIEIWSIELWRTQFYENNKFSYLLSNDRTIKNSKQLFKIKNNQLIKDKYKLIDVLKKINLEKIGNNSNEAILNELNYLNPDLDISQLEVINKTKIKAKNNSNNYIGSVSIYHYIIDNNQQNKIINLNELIKKGIFLSFRDKNQGITIKEIKNINTNNLIYSNVTATKNIEPTYTKNSKSICFGTTTLFNNLPEEQNMKTPNCEYTKETTINTKITTGLSKTEGEEKRTEQTSTSNMEHNWNFELGVSAAVETGIWPFAKVTAEIETKIGVGGTYGSSTTNTSANTKTLSNTFDFSNSKTDGYKEISKVELPSQEIKVKSKQKIKVTASLDEVLAQVTLNLKQKISGTINAKIINDNNEEQTIILSIKEAMEILQKYSLLSDEITINEDNSITFNGKANRSLKQGFNGNIEFHEVK